MRHRLNLYCLGYFGLWLIVSPLTVTGLAAESNIESFKSSSKGIFLDQIYLEDVWFQMETNSHHEVLYQGQPILIDNKIYGKQILTTETIITDDFDINKSKAILTQQVAQGILKEPKDLYQGYVGINPNQVGINVWEEDEPFINPRYEMCPSKIMTFLDHVEFYGFLNLNSTGGLIRNDYFRRLDTYGCYRFENLSIGIYFSNIGIVEGKHLVCPELTSQGYADIAHVLTLDLQAEGFLKLQDAIIKENSFVLGRLITYSVKFNKDLTVTGSVTLNRTEAQNLNLTMTGAFPLEIFNSKIYKNLTISRADYCRKPLVVTIAGSSEVAGDINFKTPGVLRLSRKAKVNGKIINAKVIRVAP